MVHWLEMEIWASTQHKEGYHVPSYVSVARALKPSSAVSAHDGRRPHRCRRSRLQHSGCHGSLEDGCGRMLNSHKLPLAAHKEPRRYVLEDRTPLRIPTVVIRPLLDQCVLQRNSKAAPKLKLKLSEKVAALAPDMSFLGLTIASSTRARRSSPLRSSPYFACPLERTVASCARW
jgi:hypothetical protein